MTTRHKDFSSGKKIKDPITFAVDDESFSARASVPGALLIDFVGQAKSEDPAEAADALMAFFDLALIDEDRERFVDFIRDPEKSIQMQTLAEIIEWLVEQYTSRPTSEPVPSQSTRVRNGRGSKVTSLKAVDSIS